MSDYLDAHQLAERLGVSFETIHRWRRSGRLPGFVRIGRRHYVWPSPVAHELVRRLGRDKQETASK